MKKLLLLLILPVLTHIAVAQDKENAEKLVTEGIAYHDKGDYEGAITRYNKALELDKDNLLALAEKSLTLVALKKYDDAISICRRAIEKHPSENALNTVYVSYGNALDGLNMTDKSIEIYDEGIKLFPGYYQLYFNKGISLSSVKKYEPALLCFQQSVSIQPKHASSDNAIARILYTQDKIVPSLLALCRFLVLEPQGGRATENLQLLQKILTNNVKQTGENNVTVNINPNLLNNAASKDKPKENDFSSAEFLLTMSAALDSDKKNASKTDTEQFIRKFESLCGYFEEAKSENTGFYWEYYVPYFMEIKKKKLIKPFAYIVFASSDKPDVQNWLKANKEEADQFFQWDKSYTWNTK